jgi:hypothetical protein
MKGDKIQAVDFVSLFDHCILDVNFTTHRCVICCLLSQQFEILSLHASFI